MSTDDLDVNDEAAAAELAQRLDYSGDSPTVEAAILAVVVQLPEAVRTFAIDRCRFLVKGSDPGNAAGSDRVAVEVEGTIDRPALLYAIAMAWLGNTAADGGKPGTAQTHEADELVAQWSFTGPGGDA
jgi:hypothetical protein